MKERHVLRHTVTGIAALAIASLALAGCSGSSDPNTSGDAGGDSATSGTTIDGTGKTLNVLVGANGLYPEEQKAWFQSVSDKFEEATGAKVAFETFASANDELTKIQTSVLSGQGPDIYGLGTTFTPTAFSTGAFVTLGDAEWEKLGGRDKFVSSLLGISGPSESEEVGIPFASRPFVMAYNTELLAAAGITEPPTTWDELTADAKKLTGDGVYGLALGYADGYDPWKFIWGMAEQAGNPILDLKDKKATIDDSAVAAAYATYFGWFTDGSVDPASIGWKNSNAVAAFADGKAAFLPMVSASSKVALDASAVKDSYAYAVLPTVPPGQATRPADGVEAASILSGDNWVVANYSQNQDLAFELIRILTEPDAQLEYFATFGEMPTTVAAAEQVQKDNPTLAPLLDAAAKSVGTPFTGAWGDTQLALTNVVVQALPKLQSGGLSASDIDSAIAEANTAAQSSLDKAK